MKKVLVHALALAVIFSSAFIVGCESDAGNGALIGALAGAAIGQAAGGDTKATVIGAGVGGAVGYGVGAHSDSQKAKATQSVQQAQTAAAPEATVWVENSDGSKTPVKLVFRNGSWTGPKGETYSTLPDATLLRTVYGK